MARPRIGVWLVGARGGVATTVCLGLAALKKGLVEPSGLVSELPRFEPLELADWKSFVVGGHEIRDVSLYDEAKRMHVESHVFDPAVLTRTKGELAKIDANIRSGALTRVGRTIEALAAPRLRRRSETPRKTIERFKADLQKFRQAQRLSHVVMVNVASTEPAVDLTGLPARWSKLRPLLERPRSCPLPASSLYAIAALELGCSYINFTPSAGATPEAIGELACLEQTRHMGYDGKTGETLLKSTLAPMFERRNLAVMSWVGHNIFGNLDGRVLEDPHNKEAKVTSKDRLLGCILGYQPQTHVSIEYIRSLGDWKTAWDHIHFKGFLGTPMMLQFTWQGCDSLLAAPLVLDLVRFTERAWRAGETGAMTFLASFFKSPLGTNDHDFTRQYSQLEAWADRVTRSAAKR